MKKLIFTLIIISLLVPSLIYADGDLSFEEIVSLTNKEISETYGLDGDYYDINKINRDVTVKSLSPLLQSLRLRSMMIPILLNTPILHIGMGKNVRVPTKILGSTRILMIILG